MLEQIRFNQSGSATKDDLANVVVVVDGTEYTPTVSSDGKYYTVKFGDGLLIKKGTNKEVYVKGDIVSGSGRTVAFDIYKAQDIVVKGQTYGYYITPATTGTGFQSSTPVYDASVVTIGAGSLVVSSSNTVAAGKIANGGSDQPLGAFLFDVTGEPISFTQMVVTISTTTTSGTGKLTNITVYDENGNILAGPQDPNSAGSSVTFTDTITLPVGKNVLVVKGNLDTNWNSNDTIQLSIQTPASALSSVTGQTTGNTITPTPSANVSANTQTVSAGALTVSPASSLASQNIINGSNNVELGRFVLDASASGEDVKVSSVQVYVTTGTNADIDELNSLTLWDGNTQITTGSNVVNPSGHNGGADGALTFTIDSGALTVAKGATKVISLKGNVNASSTPTSNTTYRFDFSDGSRDWGVTGVSTGQSITESLKTGNGATMTIVSSGTLTVTLDSSSPAETWYPAQTTGVVLGVFKFAGTNEDLAVTDLSLQLPNTASSSPADITTLYLVDDNGSVLATKNSPTFGGNYSTTNRETFTFPTSGTGSFIVPKNESRKLTVKADLAKIGTGFPGTAGNLIAIATTTTSSHHKALGLSSGSSITISGSASASDGARYFKSVPTVAKVSSTGSTLTNGTATLYEFTVSADSAGDIGLYKFTFNVATTGATATSFAVTEVETGKTVRSGVSVSGTTVEVTVNSSEYGASEITVPAGQTRTYRLTATVTGASSGDSIVTQLEGDAAYPSLSGNMDTAANIDSDTNDDFIWSDMSASSHSVSTSDWVNGYKVPGLPTTNLAQHVLSI